MKRWMMTMAMAILLPQMVSAQHQPYTGLQARPVKALSDQQMADLRVGRGMGLALAAELNGYPGPLHVMNSRYRLPRQMRRVSAWRSSSRR